MFPTMYMPGGLQITDDTYIRVYGDSSGSMSSTLDDVQLMITTLLKNALLPFYNNDSDQYDSHVQYINNSSERTLYMLRNLGVTAGGDRMIVIVFQDESSPYNAATTGVFNSGAHARTTQYNTDIAAFNAQIDAYAPGYYYGGVIAVRGYQEFSGVGGFVDNLFIGNGNYSGSNGLSGRTSYMKRRVDKLTNNGAQYYLDELTALMNDMGFFW